MELHDSLTVSNMSNIATPHAYLQRNSCPGCLESSADAELEMRSMPQAENLPFGQHGKFLSGYTNQRVFFSYFRCGSCDLLYCPTYFTQTQLNNLYMHQTENMGDVPLLARALTQEAYYKLLTKFHTPSGDYLEIGADIGLFTKLIAKDPQVGELYLYEPNCEVHDTLKSNLESKDYKILTKNYSNTDINPESIDTAVIIHTLDHVLDPRELLKGIYYNLKPGGVVFIVTHDESSLLAKLLGKKWPPYTLQHPHLFRPSTITSLLKTEGFNLLACKKTPNYFPVTHFIKGGLTAIGLNRIPLPDINKLIVPIKLGNIATIAQKPLRLMA